MADAPRAGAAVSLAKVALASAQGDAAEAFTLAIGALILLMGASAATDDLAVIATQSIEDGRALIARNRAAAAPRLGVPP